ncbi:MAG: hypothetical protein RL470_1174, partial [Actinomycetota bacterium]
DSDIAELKPEERKPSDRREFSADPTKEVTPSERRTVERMTFVASDCDSALRIPFMESGPALG